MSLTGLEVFDTKGLLEESDFGPNATCHAAFRRLLKAHPDLRTLTFFPDQQIRMPLPDNPLKDLRNFTGEFQNVIKLLNQYTSSGVICPLEYIKISYCDDDLDSIESLPRLEPGGHIRLGEVACNVDFLTYGTYIQNSTDFWSIREITLLQLLESNMSDCLVGDARQDSMYIDHIREVSLWRSASQIRTTSSVKAWAFSQTSLRSFSRLRNCSH